MKGFLTVLAAGSLVAGLSGVAVSQGAGPGGKSKPPANSQGKTQGKGQGAQQGQGRRGGFGRVQEEVLAKLNLTAPQKQKIGAIQQKTRDAMMKLRDAPGDRQQKMAKFRELSQKSRQEVLAVLTPKQKAQFEELMKAAIEKMRSERGQRNGPPPGGKDGKSGKPGKPGTPPPA